MKTLGLIPARGGSKGIPRKNLREVAGKPLIAHTILAAAASRLLTRFVTSTDDPEIAETARRFGSEVIARPPELADDQATTDAVALHALSAVAERYDALVVLQPTTPMRRPQDIDAAIALLAEPETEIVLGVAEVGHFHPARMYRIAEGALVPFTQEPPGRRRQDLPPVYIRNGMIYGIRTELLQRTGSLTAGRVAPLVLPQERSINIDTEIDLALADLLLSRERTA